MNTNDKPTGHAISFIAALFVLLCFFLPWLEVGAWFAKVNISGLQLATGGGLSGVRMPGVPSLLLIVLAMLAVGVITGATILKFKLGNGLTGGAPFILIAAGALSVLILLYQYFSLDSQVNESPLSMIAGSLIAYKFGAFAAFVGSVGVSAGGVLDLLRGKEAPASLPSLP
jgi:hypothetical protein